MGSEYFRVGLCPTKAPRRGLAAAAPVGEGQPIASPRLAL